MPSMIKYLCLIYLNQDKDGFDAKHTHQRIAINGNSIKSLHKNIVTSYLRNIVNSGTHIWKFVCHQGTGSFDSDLIGITECLDIKGNRLRGYFDSVMQKCTGYGYMSIGQLTNPRNSIICSKNYGKGWKNGDMLEMKIDFNKLELSFKVNGTDHGVAFNIGQASHRAAISLYNRNNHYEIIEYQHIY